MANRALHVEPINVPLRCHQINHHTMQQHAGDVNSNNKRTFTVDVHSEEPYAHSITGFLHNIMSGAKLNNFKQLLNALEEAFYASGEIRYGSKPDVEHVVYVRSIMSKYMEEGRPIPILVPWGSIKGKFGANLDMAEVSAINQMMALHERVTRFYVPGVQFIIRVEDTSGYQLFAMDDKDHITKSAIPKYINDFRTLISIMDTTRSIRVIYESEMGDQEHFETHVNNLIPAFHNYLKDSDDLLAGGADEYALTKLTSYLKLKDIGWTGIISPVQRNYYYNTYRKLYTAPNEDGVQYRLALYMAQAIVRRKLNMSGVQKEWNHGYVQVTFVPPVPGLPEGYDMNSIYYRTMPESCCRSHMSPWRSHGYLKIVDNASGTKICPKLTNWSDPKEFTGVVVRLSDGDNTVFISVDYTLETSK